MSQGLVKVATLMPQVKTADIEFHKEQICSLIDEALENGAKVLVFPELAITGADCAELFYQKELLEDAKAALLALAKFTERRDCIVFVGLPLAYNGKLYNVVAGLNGGHVLGLVPKTYIPSHGQKHEAQYFASGMEKPVPVMLDDDTFVPMGTQMLFGCRQMKELQIGVEIGTDFWAPNPPSVTLAMVGATMIINPSAVQGNGQTAKMVDVQSGRLICSYLYCSQDGNIISENGRLVAMEKDSVCADVDVYLAEEYRRKNSLFHTLEEVYITADFSLKDMTAADNEKKAESILDMDWEQFARSMM